QPRLSSSKQWNQVIGSPWQRGEANLLGKERQDDLAAHIITQKRDKLDHFMTVDLVADLPALADLILGDHRAPKRVPFLRFHVPLLSKTALRQQGSGGLRGGRRDVAYPILGYPKTGFKLRSSKPGTEF
ncbi:MAG: hypothetical protein B7X29_09885, partial [Halothiobacillus sp. 13-55-115]